MRIPIPATEPFVGTGADLGFTQRAHQQALANGPFGNTCEADAVSPKETKRGVAGQICLQPLEYQVDLIQQECNIHISLTKIDLPYTVINLI
jgi:hypothetical protein